MIVSCHIPKTAGMSFGRLLQRHFMGSVMSDYGDRVGWTGPEADAWRRRRGIPEAIKEAVTQGNVSVIHGHFYISKYAEAYPDADLICFVRDPVARVISNYRFLLENPQIDHPLVRDFHATRRSLSEWAELPWARNLQTAIVDVPIRNLAMIGVTEKFDTSLKIFDRKFNTNLRVAVASVRDNRSSVEVPVTSEVVSRIRSLNSLDQDLYDHACGLVDRG